MRPASVSESRGSGLAEPVRTNRPGRRSRSTDGYFHVVSSLPSELRTLGRPCPTAIFNLLFEAASDTLLTLGRDPRRMGGLVGLTAVLHTWKRDLQAHPTCTAS
jgi:hypothetical protein